ncbi:tripartite tricarboxylate transporter TctB family protein [Nitratireductor sp. GCM10026969]|uniref:tripartite tricarboxylate transporter TctB family protein n=1 Tax=Nitratireductor sp. GCM10026969 TaxID=3252645 RepID=UPI003621DB8A
MSTGEISHTQQTAATTRSQDLAAVVVGAGAFLLGLWMVLDIAAMEDNPIASLSGGIDAKQYPTWLGVALMGLALAVVVRPGYRLVTTHGRPDEALPWARIFSVIVALFLCVLAFRQLGYIASTTLFGAALMTAGGARRPLPIAGFPLALTLVLYWIVRLVFDIHLPFGRLWSGLIGG